MPRRANAKHPQQMEYISKAIEPPIYGSDTDNIGAAKANVTADDTIEMIMRTQIDTRNP
jgi:hypothetical protein